MNQRYGRMQWGFKNTFSKTVCIAYTTACGGTEAVEDGGKWSLPAWKDCGRQKLPLSHAASRAPLAPGTGEYLGRGYRQLDTEGVLPGAPIGTVAL